MTTRHLLVERSISHTMTSMPHSIGGHESLLVARRMMREHGFRHLPVLEGGSLVGLLSEADLNLMVSLDEADWRELSVREAMNIEPFVVSPNAPLAEICRLMVDRKLEVALVLNQGHLVGIFSAVDALAVLADVLEGKPPAPGPHVPRPKLAHGLRGDAETAASGKPPQAPANDRIPS